MSYTLTLQCGCMVYVACHPMSGLAHTRVIERRGAGCPERMHDIGRHLQLRELRPDPDGRPSPEPLRAPYRRPLRSAS